MDPVAPVDSRDRNECGIATEGELVRREKMGPRAAPELVQRVEVALNKVDSARLALGATTASRASLNLRRAASAELRHSFDAADACLREATLVAKQRSRHDWAHWRKRLSDLDTRRQIHLIAELDADGILSTNSVRAIDTGMSGPGHRRYAAWRLDAAGKPRDLWRGRRGDSARRVTTDGLPSVS